LLASCFQYLGFRRQEMEDELLTTSAAARVLGVASETVRYWQNTGKLRAVKASGGVRLFVRDEVERVRREREERLEPMPKSGGEAA
jgi:excisionase family DNA binding protein